MAEVKKLRGIKPRGGAKKRAFPPDNEQETRQKNLRSLAVLGGEDSSVRLLEELVFGAEDELVERLVEVCDLPALIRGEIC